MSPLLRWVSVPFLLLFGLTVFVLGGAGLEALGLTDTNVFLNNRLLETLGVLGSLLQIVLTVNAACDPDVPRGHAVGDAFLELRRPDECAVVAAPAILVLAG